MNRKGLTVVEAVCALMFALIFGIIIWSAFSVLTGKWGGSKAEKPAATNSRFHVKAYPAEFVGSLLVIYDSEEGHRYLVVRTGHGAGIVLMPEKKEKKEVISEKEVMSEDHP